MITPRVRIFGIVATACLFVMALLAILIVKRQHSVSGGASNAKYAISRVASVEHSYNDIRGFTSVEMKLHFCDDKSTTPGCCQTIVFFATIEGQPNQRPGYDDGQWDYCRFLVHNDCSPDGATSLTLPIYWLVDGKRIAENTIGFGGGAMQMDISRLHDIGVSNSAKFQIGQSEEVFSVSGDDKAKIRAFCEYFHRPTRPAPPPPEVPQAPYQLKTIDGLKKSSSP